MAHATLEERRTRTTSRPKAGYPTTAKTGGSLKVVGAVGGRDGRWPSTPGSFKSSRPQRQAKGSLAAGQGRHVRTRDRGGIAAPVPLRGRGRTIIARTLPTI